jgi:hypothetical protein
MTPSVDSLYQMSDSNVKDAVQTTVQSQIGQAPAVSLFFPNAGPDTSPVPSWNSKVAVGLVCSSIGSTSLYGFDQTINQSAANAFWQNLLSDTNTDAITTSQTLYDSYFPLLCVDDSANPFPLPFMFYLADEGDSHWGSQLSDYLQDSAFINTTMLKIVADDPNYLQTLNLALYKLHLLDDSLVTGVVNTWTSAAPSAGIVANWQAYSYLPATMFQPDGFLAEVDTQINVVTHRLLGYSGQMTIFGENVVEFLLGVPSDYGLVADATAASNTSD